MAICSNFHIVMLVGITLTEGQPFMSEVWTPTVELVTNVLNVLQWKHLTFIHSNERQCWPIVEQLQKYFDEQNISRIVYKQSDSFFQINLWTSIHSQFFPHIHLVYISCSSLQKMNDMMRIINDFDSMSNRTTDFRSKSQWLLVRPSPNQNDGLVDNYVTIPDLCHVALIQPIQNENYSCGTIKTLTKTHCGGIFTNVRKPLSKSTIYPNLRFKWNKRHLVIGTLPFILLKRRTENNQSVYYGNMMKLLTAMSTYLNFTYELVEPVGEIWGTETANNTFTGLLGMSQKHEVDIIFAEFVITNERRNIMEFILPSMFTTTLGLIYKEPEGASLQSWVAIFRPFSTNVYIFLMISFLYFLTIYIIIDVVIPWYCNCSQIDDGFGILFIVFALFGCLTQESIDIKPRTRSSHILLISWWLFSIAMAATYIANLSSLLLVPKVETFSNLEDLINANDWKFGLLGQSSSATLFETSSVPSFQAAWEKIIEFNRTDPGVLSEDVFFHVDKALTSRYVFIVVNPLAVQMISHCKLKYSKFYIALQYVTFGVPVNSPLKKDIEQFMSLVFENRIYEYSLENHTRCEKEDKTSEIQPIYLGNIIGAFLMLFVGIAFSLFVLMVEICITKYNRN
ncbi:hypothetical protein LOTGIDRAFT_169256 [Lottia gigantea]|uniref:Ionotropic glutamate receptor L-glutamate and glycine-binding domain-containing protein n=1 Tax=Lottia gigantea TaxID=225164 RepID=V3ZHA3_LOTGI|nr:hypothetical protein LOTGIDRAFT_169256 [Lottia gigantea]ESO83562.1 hypothetical protein LOTGIDRAFT_169256 [Lottia gigantea]